VEPLPSVRSSFWRVDAVLDMFALSDLVTRPAGHAVADQAAARIRKWIKAGVPGTPR
jgi:hypothetical protein